MKEDMLEVLIYLFENYIIDGVSFEPGHDELAEELVGAGFAGEEIDKAFVWLEDLMDICEQDENQRLSFDSAEGSLPKAEGSLEQAKGSLNSAEGSLELAEGSLELAEGSLELAESSLELAEGSIDSAEGSLEPAEGSKANSNGGLIGKEHVVNIAAQSSVSPIRFYTEDEMSRLNIEGQSLLTRLFNIGILDLFSREMVIDRVMALDSQDVNLDHIKWVVLMVLSNQPGFAEIAEWAEVVVTEDLVPVIH